MVRRPADTRPGAAAPWGRLPAAGRRELTLERVAGALRKAGQDGEPPPPPLGAPRPSAVLVALFEDSGEVRTVLTRRSDSLRSHRGEISFPGGRIEPGETAFETACREATEEVGLDAGLVRPAGWLQPLSTFSSASFITPVVGILKNRPSLVANRHEVARIFDVAVADLVSDGVYHEEIWTVDGSGSFPVKFFEVARETVWGATARVLFELCCLLLGAVLGTPPPPGIVKRR